MNYEGNAIYDYILENNLDYFFCTKNRWTLVYGDSMGIPKVIVLVSKVNDIRVDCSDEEKGDGNRVYNIAKYLKLPFVFVRFMLNSNVVSVWESCVRVRTWNTKTYDQLRDLYEEYGVVQPGTAGKAVNQYVSSSYHDWQRQNLGRITVSDIDLIKYKNNRIEEIIELKRSKISLEDWHPYEEDYPNFALLINTIVNSGKPIPFSLYYNVMKDGPAGKREEDISRIKVFDFDIPDRMTECDEITYNYRGTYPYRRIFT